VGRGDPYNEAAADPGQHVDQRRKQLIGIAGLVVGFGMLVAGMLWAHFTGLDAENAFGEEIYPFFPRGWVWETLGQLTAVAGSQVMIAAVVFAWVWGRQMTWALAAVSAGLFTLEMIILFGIVPNEWLALTQGELEWTSQNVAVTIPEWLVLGNQVDVSYGAIKDAVVAGYATTMLGVVLVTVYQLQERAKRQKTAPPRQLVSSYGRPIVKGDR